MTVCIAALAETGSAIVMACDSMISTGEFSGDHIAYKLYPLHPTDWWAMFAAEDVAQVVPTVNRMTNLVASAEPLTLSQASQLCATAYQEARRLAAQDKILSPLGCTFDEFKSHGAAMYPDEHRDITADLRSYDLGCELLVAGFDRDGDGNVFTVGNPGMVRNHNPVGYWAIGSGAYSALSIMFHHSVNYEWPLERVLYHVCEAKFMAESAVGVGKDTVVAIARPGKKTKNVHPAVVANIRAAWEDGGKPRVPNWAIDKLKDEVIARIDDPHAVERSWLTPSVAQKSAGHP